MPINTNAIKEFFGFGAALALSIYFGMDQLREFQLPWSIGLYLLIWALAIAMFRRVSPVRWLLLSPVKAALWPLMRSAEAQRKAIIEERFRLSRVRDKKLRKYVTRLADRQLRLERRIERIRTLQSELVETLEQVSPAEETADPADRYRAAATPGVVYDPGVDEAVTSVRRPLEGAAYPDPVWKGPPLWSRDEFQNDQMEIKDTYEELGTKPRVFVPKNRQSRVQSLSWRIGSAGRDLAEAAGKTLDITDSMQVPPSRQRLYEKWSDGVDLLIEAGDEFDSAMEEFRDRQGADGPLQTRKDMNAFDEANRLLALAEAKLEEAAADQRDWGGYA
jgi:hypothetical protein